MSIELAEKLKRDLTDKYVVVAPNVPELRRFAELTGRVKTVNMNCRALVEFDSAEDIGWYDIDPTYLTVVDAPKPKAKAKAAPAAEASAAKAAPRKPAGSGKSPLEMAREQGAAKSGGAKPSPLEMARQQDGGAQTAPAGEAKKLSPLELARQQDGGTAPASGKKLSPLELARQQDGGGAPGTPAPVEEAAPATAAEEPADEAAASPSAGSSIPTTGPDGKPLSIIELARLQGPFKG